jgi:DNA-binding NarL/FixJ family response regulator
MACAKIALFLIKIFHGMTDAVNRTGWGSMKDIINILLVDDDAAEEIIMRSLMKRVSTYNIVLHYCDGIEAAREFIMKNKNIHLILMDNMLYHGSDFRDNVPLMRQNGFIGPIGVISSSVDDPYFQTIEEFGADFRIDKAEFDPTAIEFIIREYLTTA